MHRSRKELLEPDRQNLAANIHGREITTAEIAMLFMDWMCSSYDHHPDVTWMVDHQETWIVPVANPDGRDQLLWVNARGVDINRNFSYQWGLDSGSTPGNRGSAPFSEPETQALRDLLLTRFPDQRRPGEEEPADSHTSGMVIQLHSNGQLMLWPWGYSTEPPPNADDFQRIAGKLRLLDDYQIGPLGSTLFLVSGMLDDWVYGELGVTSFLREVLDAYYDLDPPYHIVEVAVTDGAKTVRHQWEVMVSPDPRVFVIDNGDPGTLGSGTWRLSRAWFPWGPHALISGEDAATYRWIPALPQAGTYDLYAWWTYGRPSRASAVPYQIQHASGTDVVLIDQSDPARSGRWDHLGTFNFLSGESGFVQISTENGSASADAVKLVLRLGNETEPVLEGLPALQTVIEGSRAWFSVSARGAEPMSYQWRKDGDPVPGATASSFSLLNVGGQSQGCYDVEVSNGFGTAISLPTELRILEVMTWPEPPSMVYGTPLGDAHLNARAIVPGTLYYDPEPGTVLSVGDHLLKVTFVPDEPTRYPTATVTVALRIDPAPLIVRAENVTRAYSEENPPLTYAVEGLVNGDAADVVAGVVLTTTARRIVPSALMPSTSRAAAQPITRSLTSLAYCSSNPLCRPFTGKIRRRFATELRWARTS